MKYPQNRQTVIINQLDKIMTGNGISNSELSQVSGVARPTIIRIRHDATQDWQSGTMLKIANALDVPVKSLFREQLVFDPKDVRNGFSPENLNQLDRCLSAHGLQLRYQPYSWQCKMNVRSKYRTNWRVSFVGNWQFHDGIHSELVLINCDAQRNRKTATSLDVDNLFSAIIASAIDYAKLSRGTLFRHPFVTLFRPETTLFRRTNVTFLIFNLVIRQIIPSVGLEY